MKTYLTPKYQQLNIEGVKHISPQDAYALLTSNEATLIDLREPDETAYGTISLDLVLYHPVSVFLERMATISKDQTYILCCAHGIRSIQVVKYLQQNGYNKLINLDGGFAQWKSFGLPTTSGFTFMGGCGCDTENSAESSCCTDDSCSTNNCCSV